MAGFFNKILGGGNKLDLGDLIGKGAIIVDVRSPREYASGHVKGSLNIPLDKLDKQMAKLEKKGKPVITCCASGMRSRTAASKLKARGIEAYNGGPWTKVNRFK